MTNFEKEKKQLEQEKQKLKHEKEVIVLRKEVADLKNQTADVTGVRKFGKMWLSGAKTVFGTVLKAGEGISKVDASEAMGLKRKPKDGSN